MKGEEKKVDKFKEKGRKWNEKGRKGENKEKMESNRVKKCEIGKNRGKKGIMGV
jgi:hypothetical protein